MTQWDKDHSDYLSTLAGAAVEIYDEVDRAITSAIQQSGEFLDKHKDHLIPLMSSLIEALITHHAPRNKAVARYMNGPARGVAADIAAHLTHHSAAYFLAGKTYDPKKDATTIIENAARGFIRARLSA